VKDGAHWIAEQHPELVNQYIREFLADQGMTRSS
jgi:pimeloyl-ACP methyl ester carboxylesterase